jgi:hypothetical protein
MKGHAIRYQGVSLPSLFCAAILVAVVHQPVAGGETYLAVQSDPGDQIGLGQSYFYDLSDHNFFGSLYPAGFPLPEGHVSNLQFVIVNVLSKPPVTTYKNFWTFDFSSVYVSPALTVGDYADAEAYPYQSPGHPSLNLETDNGSNIIELTDLTGSFHVYQADFTNPNDPHFAVDFEIHDNGDTPALRGQLRVDSDYGVPEPTTATLLLLGMLGCGWRRRR